MDQYNTAKRLSSYDLLNKENWNNGESQAAYETAEAYKDSHKAVYDAYKSAAANNFAAGLYGNNVEDSVEKLINSGKYTKSDIAEAARVYALEQRVEMNTYLQNKVWGTADSDLLNVLGGLFSTGSMATGAIDELSGSDIQDEETKTAVQDMLKSAQQMQSDASLGSVGSVANSVAQNLALGAIGGASGSDILLPFLSMEGAADQARKNYDAGSSDLSNLLSTGASYGYNYFLNDKLNPIANGTGDLATNLPGIAIAAGIGAVNNGAQSGATTVIDALNDAVMDYSNDRSLENMQAPQTLEALGSGIADSSVSGAVSGGILGGINGSVNVATGHTIGGYSVDSDGNVLLGEDESGNPIVAQTYGEPAEWPMGLTENLSLDNVENPLYTDGGIDQNDLEVLNDGLYDTGETDGDEGREILEGERGALPEVAPESGQAPEGSKRTVQVGEITHSYNSVPFSNRASGPALAAQIAADKYGVKSDVSDGPVYANGTSSNGEATTLRDGTSIFRNDANITQDNAANYAAHEAMHNTQRTQPEVYAPVNAALADSGINISALKPGSEAYNLMRQYFNVEEGMLTESNISKLYDELSAQIAGYQELDAERAKEIFGELVTDYDSVADVISETMKHVADTASNRAFAEPSFTPNQAIPELGDDYHEDADFGPGSQGAAKSHYAVKDAAPSQFRTNTLSNADVLQTDRVQGIVQKLDKAGAFNVDSESEAQSLQSALEDIAVDADGAAKDIIKNGIDHARGAEGVDLAMQLMISDETSSQDVSKLMQRATEFAHESGQNLQAFAKYTRTAAGTLTKAQQIIDQQSADWVKGHQKDASAVKDLSADIADKIKSAGDSQENVENIIRKALKESGISDSLKKRVSDNDIKELAKRVAETGFDTKEVEYAFDNFFSSGLWEFSAEDVDAIRDIYTEMENYEVGSKEYESLQNQAFQLIADKVCRSNWSDKFRAWRYLSMLSSIKTSLKNIGGNVSMGMLSNAKENVLYALQSIHNKIHPNNQINITAPLDRAADAADISAAYADTESGGVNPDLTDGGSKYSVDRGIEANKRIFKNPLLEKTRQMYSNLYGAQDEYGAGGALVSFGSLEGKNALSAAMKNLGTKTESAIKSMADKGIVGFGGLKNQFARVAVRYAKANGYSYADLIKTEQRISDQLRDAIATDEKVKVSTEDAKAMRVLTEARTRGIEEAQKATFHDLNKISDAAMKLGKIPGFGPAFMPFSRTAGNILARGIDYSPVGIAKLLYHVHNGEGASKILNDAAEITTGTGLLAAGFIAGAMGIVNASGSGDDRKDYYDENIYGKQDYSVNLPNGGTYTLGEWTAPACLPFFVGVEVQNAMGGDGNLVDALSSLSAPMLENTILQSINDALSSIKYSDMDPATTIVASGTASYLGQYIPTVAKQIGRAFEPSRSSSYSSSQSTIGRIFDKTINNSINWIPSLQDEISYDQWGRPLENVGGNVAGRLAYNLLSLGYYAADQSTPVDDELERLSDALDDTSVLPQSAILTPTVKVDGENRRMTESEMQTYAQIKGQTSYDMIESLMDADGYHGMTDDQKADAISDIYSLANRVAKDEAVEGYDAGDDKLFGIYQDYGADTAIDYLSGSAAIEASGAENQQERAQALIGEGYDEDTAGQIYALSSGATSLAYKAYEQYGAEYAYYMMQANASGITGNSKKDKIVAYLDQQGYTTEQKRTMFSMLSDTKNPY